MNADAERYSDILARHIERFIKPFGFIECIHLVKSPSKCPGKGEAKLGR